MTIPPLTIQRGTTNILTNPVFTGDGTGWSKSSLTGVTDGAVTREGVASLRVDLTVAVTGNTYVGDFSNTVIPGEPYVARVYARAGRDGCKMSARLQGSTFSSTLQDVATEGWTEIIVQMPVTPAGITNASYFILFDPATCQIGDRFWVVQPQMEHGLTPTSFTVGARPAQSLPGFLRLGSPHIGPLRAGKA